MNEERQTKSHVEWKETDELQAEDEGHKSVFLEKGETGFHIQNQKGWAFHPEATESQMQRTETTHRDWKQRAKFNQNMIFGWWR